MHIGIDVDVFRQVLEGGAAARVSVLFIFIGVAVTPTRVIIERSLIHRLVFGNHAYRSIE